MMLACFAPDELPAGHSFTPGTPCRPPVFTEARPHPAHRLDYCVRETRVAHVLVRFVEDDELVEEPPFRVARLREEAQHDHEQGERFLLLDQRVSDVDDEETARPDVLAGAANVRR